jgi:hypothetical protein
VHGRVPPGAGANLCEGWGPAPAPAANRHACATTAWTTLGDARASAERSLRQLLGRTGERLKVVTVEVVTVEVVTVEVVAVEFAKTFAGVAGC